MNENFAYTTGKLQLDRSNVANKLISEKEKGTFWKPHKQDLKSKDFEHHHRAAPIAPDIDRVPTGIFGLDDVMGGGLERNSVNLVGGSPGSGKSIFGMQFIINGIEKYNENGVYVTFEEPKEKFFKHMNNFGWDLSKYEDSGKLIFIEYTPTQVKQILQEGGGMIENSISKSKAKRIVLDSLTAFVLLYPNELSRRRAVLDLFDLFYKWGLTSLLIVEQELDPDKHVTNALEFEVDGVILLYNIRKGNVRERALEILKLRGTAHSSKLFPLKITNNGVSVYPEETFF